MLVRSASLRRGAAAALLLALVLTGCAQPATVPTASPRAQDPDASAPPTPIASAADPSASAAPEPDAEPDVGATWATQDGAMRLRLPEGWRVDDRSAMGEASEMHDRGPGWLNDVMLLDDGGDQMLWYREAYGNDFIGCREVQADSLEIDIEPYSPALVDELERQGASAPEALILAETAEAATWEPDAAPGTWSVAMGVVARLPAAPGEGCSDLTEMLWLGNRIAEIDVVGDAAGADGEPDPTIDFADERGARAWLEGDEAAMLVEVLSSIELTGAPVLDAAP